MKITYCIPSKNNLRYLKNSIQSIKENSSVEYDIIVFIDGDNDRTEQWCKENNIIYLLNTLDKPKGIAYAYNKCIKAANTDIVCMFHADMYMGKGFDVNCLKHLKEKIVVSGTRIEPPLHPSGLEKIVRNFGMYPEDFTKDLFNEFVEVIKKQQKDQVTYGIFAPWMCFRSELLEIGMHDELFHSYHEDSDIFNRMILNGMKCIQSRDSLVYHLTCRGGQFQDGIEKITQDIDFHKMKDTARKLYIKKWGSWIKNNEYQYPILTPVYKKRAIIQDYKPSPVDDWFSEINPQDPSSFDVVVELNTNTFAEEEYHVVINLNQIVQETNEIGKFQVGNLTITINSLADRSKELIFIDNND
jgi:glycosyltransferase involved in cell wall biosynthesis